MNPEYPVYVISKGRAESRLTHRALMAMRVPHHVVIEPTELEDYASVIPRDMLLVLPFHDLGAGSIPARNWVWDHASSTGAARHWILDDNIRSFYRLHMNQKIRWGDGSCFRLAEHFVDRYDNVPMSGFQSEMFAPRRERHLPFVLNTRVYSCILLDSRRPERWRGRYNEDTDLSIRFLKNGDCTILFYAFLADKQPTMRMSGGNTDELYSPTDGRLLMAESLVQQHPDVARITWKWGRWQHHVDYSPFLMNRLKRRAEYDRPTWLRDAEYQLIEG